MDRTTPAAAKPHSKYERLAVELADTGLLKRAAENILCRLFEEWFKADTLSERERLYAEAGALERIRVELANELAESPAVVQALIGYDIKIARRWPWQKK